MDLKLSCDDRVRIDGSYCNESNFIDVRKASFSGIELTLFCGVQYIEIRRKGDLLKLFTFPKKSHKKEHDFVAWSDAQVVHSLNEQCMNKG